LPSAQIASKLFQTFCTLPQFSGVPARVTAYAKAAKLESETMKTDRAIFDVWPEFVATGDELYHFDPRLNGAVMENPCVVRGVALIREGKKIIEWVAFARVPMPKTARNFVERCDQYLAAMKMSQVA
jgi:hypothetical protein